MDRKLALDKICKEIGKCRICRRDSIGLPVPGEGNPNAKLVLIGEAPGKTEAQTGRPFVGRSGKLLREQISKIGLAAEDVFITSPVKYLPKKGTPTAKQILHGMIHLQKQLDVIAPKILVLMGSTAAFAILGKKISISQNHGQILPQNGKKYLLLYHPAAALRFPKLRKVFVSDFRKLRKLL